jgi:hypothetical protein
MKKTAWWLCAVAACVACGLLGCRRASEKMAEKAIERGLRQSGGGDAQVDLSGGKMTIKTAEGEMEFSGGESVALPAGFPDDVYVDPKAKLRAAMKTPQGFMLNLESPLARDAAAEAIDAAMKAKGWSQEASVDMSEMRSISYKKGNRTAAAIVMTQEGATQITLTVMSDQG